ncbi:hypothetical protein [Pseudoxanthomonas winnipegensis]|uniref:hypothetical protein n=1 Tax=Pseudoxanthomonas winnipegensis TaxID=2480810 RepID=UPI00103A654B|nr:hypothetical protein [Pseudoxanthomonas winnipegensis]TBV73265.1 hypothetical protein EYC45_12845 [Pseudoxanthomonas winnipegensis]
MRWTAGLVFMLLSSPCFSATNIEGLKVKRLSTGWSGEALYVDAQGSLPTGEDCGGGAKFILSSQEVMYKEMVSTLLTALQNGYPVDLFSGGCNGIRINLKAVSVYTPN